MAQQGQGSMDPAVLDDIIRRLLDYRNPKPGTKQISSQNVMFCLVLIRLELVSDRRLRGPREAELGDNLSPPRLQNQIPENFFLLRGNHECASINRIYGFYDECKRRFSVRLWKVFTDSFNCLPVAAVIDDKILCMHGGLSPDLTNVEQIKTIKRPTDVPDTGLLCDLLWSDPSKDVKGWGMNDRGVSYTFGADKVAEFLIKNDMDLICRAHQVVEDGYEFFADRQLVTIFSAPNYCGEFDNAGAMMSVDESLMCSFQILKPADRRPGSYDQKR
ncbi:hypothetical protein Bca52824_004608 [Brassica carinata]|uniref:Serine/threonine-protein phosphatase n=1 Tax=Brassica carinata TaxID=52824 RepID=A0A8X8BG99_BRACI|nr:hypothetical protein Bca52824_004608 [Brassica carinata]